MSDPEEILQRVISSNPIDQTARLVTGRGIHFESRKKILQRHASTPLPLDRCNSRKLPSYQGVRVGRFTVIGPSPKTAQRATWVVRCDCGNYETRRSKSINQPDPKDCCQLCRELQHLQRNQYFRSTGHDMPERT